MKKLSEKLNFSGNDIPNIDLDQYEEDDIDACCQMIEDYDKTNIYIGFYFFWVDG